MSEPIDITGGLRSEDYIRLTRGMDDNDIRDLFMETYRLEEEVARLRAILANCYTVKPLEWAFGTDRQGNRFARCFKSGTKLEVNYYDNGWCWFGNNCGSTEEGIATSLEDGMALAESWRLARVTAPLTKIEVPS